MWVGVGVRVGVHLWVGVGGWVYLCVAVSTHSPLQQPPPKPEAATSLPNQDQGISYGLLFKLAIGILVLLLVYSAFISPYLKK